MKKIHSETIFGEKQPNTYMATVLVEHFEIGVIPFVVVFAYLHCPSIDINVE